MAGKFGKPRSSDFEEVNGVKLPSYRRDNINGDTLNDKDREPDPHRMVRAYSQAAATLNLLRAFATGGYAAMQRVSKWNLSDQGEWNTHKTIGFVEACGLTENHPIMNSYGQCLSSLLDSCMTI